MQPEHIRMSDHSPSVGEERMVFVQPNPQPLSGYGLTDYWRSLQASADPVMMRTEMVEARLADLESRIAELESRTWWSMLKEWISACRLRFIGR